MNSTLKTIIYVVLGFMVVSLIARLFFNLLPYVLIIGAILFVYFKLKGYFLKKKKGNSTKNNTETYNSNDSMKYSSEVVEDDMNAEIIDVDYKDVE